MSLPTIYKQASSGAIQQWLIDAYGASEDGAEVGVIETVWGQVGGTQQVAKDIIRQGKNVGRSNETSPIEQAVAEANARFEQKLKKGYVRTIEEAKAGKTDAIVAGGVAPMLAHSYEKQGHKIKYPALVQPKLDGHRCIAVVKSGKCTLWSRTRKLITGVPHIARELEARFPNKDIVFDGELYNHDYRENFDELTSFIRQQTPKPGHDVVQYWVYDIVSDKTQEQRLRRIAFMGQNKITKSVIPVPTERVESEEEMIAVFGAYMSHGFEGLMVRNLDAKYKVGGRSYDLLKVKIFQDAEYPVVGIETGRGKMSDKAIFVCETPHGERFRCKLVGELDALKSYLDEPEKWIGKQLTVKYQNLTPSGMPRFPVAMRFREDV